MRVIIAGGGTGGHVIPGVAIAQELQKAYNSEVLFVGTPRGIENRLVPAAGFSLQLVEVGALKNVSITTRIRTMLALPQAIWQSRRILKEFRPDVVIGVGGYASGPMMAAAISRRIPTLAFEPNVIPGFANRMVARFVSGAAVHFPETSKFFRRCEITGVPVRQAFFDVARTPHPNPVLLVFGGSQGSHAINKMVFDSVAQLRQRVPNLHIIHQTGVLDYEPAQKAYGGNSHDVEIHRFIDDMPSFFARADLLLCRSGASTVAEIEAAGKPAIFVPFPRAADDHQKRNAEALERSGAAVMIEESKLNAEILAETVSGLLTDPTRLEKMGEAARRLAHPRAARDIANMAAKLVGN